jgi:hypothetical protein
MLIKVADALEIGIDELALRSEKPDAAEIPARPSSSSEHDNNVDAILGRCKMAIAEALNIDSSRVQLKVVLSYD